ncbi:bifunctional diaminohydroxyphosphoribosylaminopyrimidine deaminase/5-amino-6-(5-phosphoribosylamino)uracil reductase RibD [candidate division KSB1 bacterium]|nr:bifunctional diaminohydroxyphosphoribosylaminopyrimidine deaminase/5-amino-6-(5-phosphoribosylamino)uracil reductase RibD [candidate division KSB1 bacterium]
MTDDELFIRRTLRLAKKGKGKTSPNPLVGAILVKDCNVIAEGYHRAWGEDHAELMALKMAGKRAQGATIYVNLEPCCHHDKKTPPCVDRILTSGLKKVVVGSEDPNPQVSGKGLGILKNHGIEVVSCVLEDQCRRLNEVYFKNIQTGLPFVTLKIAQTLDGQIATPTGDSQWITSDRMRRLVHRLRAESDAVLVGIGTVKADDPELTVRWVKGKNPVRVVLDSHLSIPLTAKVLNGKDPSNTILFTATDMIPSRADPVKKQGARVFSVPTVDDGRLNLKEVLVRLGKEGINSLLVEGGREVFTSFVKSRLFDKMILCISPKVIGKGLGSLGDLGISRVGVAVTFSGVHYRRLRDEMIVEVWK